MKRIYLIAILLLAGMVAESYAQAAAEKPLAGAGKQTIDVYYFHATRRCYSCNNVENQSKAALEKLYPKQMESGDIVFHSVNFENAEGQRLSKELQTSGITLLIVKGKEKRDLTSEGFMYASRMPEKLQESIKKAIDPML